MKKTLPCIFLLILLIAPARGGDDEKELRREISLLNLVNGLYLTEEQLVKLVDLSGSADQVRSESRRAHESEKINRVESFQRLRDELVYGAHVPKDVRDSAVRLNRSSRKLRDSHALNMAGLAEEADGIFTEGQKQIIADFKPCLTPPKNLKNPERAGQANSSDGIVKKLSRLRKAPRHRYGEINERILDRHTQKFAIQEGPFLTTEEIEAERQRVSALLDRAVAATDVDFEMQKEELAKEFKHNKDKPGKSPKFKIARFFLSPGATGILEDKLSGMRSLKEQASSDEKTITATGTESTP